MRLGQTSAYTQRLMRSLGELSVALERAATGASLTIPPSCNEFVEINRLLVAMRVNQRNVMPVYTPAAQPDLAGRASTEQLTSGTLPGTRTRRPFPTSGLLQHLPASGSLQERTFSAPPSGAERRSQPLAHPVSPFTDKEHQR